MNPASSYILGIAALAVALAENLNDDQLNLLSAALVQLGDTLATLAVQRAILNPPASAQTEPLTNTQTS